MAMLTQDLAPPCRFRNARDSRANLPGISTSPFLDLPRVTRRVRRHNQEELVGRRRTQRRMFHGAPAQVEVALSQPLHGALTGVEKGSDGLPERVVAPGGTHAFRHLELVA